MSFSHCQSKHPLCNQRDSATIAKVFDYMKTKYGIDDRSASNVTLHQLQIEMNEMLEKEKAGEDGRIGDWIQTYTGRRFYPFDPRPEDFDIVDIAWSLSNAVRFCGHVSEPITVAQHSILVSRFCDQQDALWGLLHDASEAYIADMSTPIKKSREMAGYRSVEHRIMEAMCERYGLPKEQPASVHRADKAVLAAEVRNFMRPVDPGFLKSIEQYEDLKLNINVMDRVEAYNEFLHRFQILGGK